MPVLVVVGLLAAAVVGFGSGGFGTVLQTAPAAGSCSLAAPAFCETFDAPAGTPGNRSGQLNGTLWGVSRLTGNQNFSSPSNGWPSSTLNICGASQTIAPDHDILICDGRLQEGEDDNGTVTAITMYPKQPFDFAGRTGKVTFDVSNDSAGSHSAWPELWITDKPTSGPFAHEDSFQSLPQNGLGIRFAGYSNGTCPEGGAYIGVDSAITVSNYVENDTFNGGNLALNGLDCIKKSTSPTSLNHYEVDISQDQIDIYGTDAGTTAPLKHLSRITHAGLTFSRGLVWIEDAHYNGNKFGNQGTHAFTWDNVGFDGPVVTRDLTYDVPDNTTLAGKTDVNNGQPVTNLGYFIQGGQTKTFTLNGVSTANATAALLTYNFYYQAPSGWTMAYTVNGHPHTLASPNPQFQGFSPDSVIFPITLSEVVPGTNVISFTPPVSTSLMNIDLVMVGAGASGATPVPPTATPVPPTPTVAATSTPAATATVAVSGCTEQLSLNGTPTTYTRPVTSCANQ